MQPEIAMEVERLHSVIVWMKILHPHPPRKRKSLLMELHAFGGISDEALTEVIAAMELMDA